MSCNGFGIRRAFARTMESEPMTLGIVSGVHSLNAYLGELNQVLCKMQVT